MGLHPANKPATRHVNMRMPKPTHERHNARTMGSQSLAPPLTLIQHLID